jgi:hypothetical protein
MRVRRRTYIGLDHGGGPELNRMLLKEDMRHDYV